MPSHKSFKKSIIKSEKRRLKNKSYKTRIKNIFKTAENIENEKKTDLLKLGYKVIDKACAKHVIKKNKAARKKSQLAKLLS